MDMLFLFLVEVLICFYFWFCFVLFLQLEASTQQDLNTMKPLFDLPPKILCRVMNVRLQVCTSLYIVWTNVCLVLSEFV